MVFDGFFKKLTAQKPCRRVFELMVFFKKLTAQKPCRRVFEGAAGFYRFRSSLFLFLDLYLVPGAPDQLKCSLKCRWFSRHTVHLERKVEFICAEGYLSRCSRHLFQAQYSLGPSNSCRESNTLRRHSS